LHKDLHTVIITDRRSTPLFEIYRRLFAPFFTEHGGSICQCTWDEACWDIEHAVPDLYKSIKGHWEWRAIILVNPEQNELVPFSPDNPFDFDCNRGKELLIQENPAPLVRLTHMLAGFPSLGVNDYEIGYSYYDPGEGKSLKCCHKDGSPILKKDVEKLSDLYEEFGENIEPYMYEIPYPDGKMVEYKRLTKIYAFKENRPVEILVLTVRDKSEPDDRQTTREAIRHAWEFYDEEESSDFWKIYPNTCRFLCYDLINPEHTLYPRELWQFFLLAVTLAFNEIPCQSLQAYHLYKANLKIDADDLGRVLDNHIKKLLSVQAVIYERVLRTPKLTQEKKKELVPTQDISVKFEQVDEGDLTVDGEKLGLASDCPISERKFWHDHIQGTRQTIDNILSAPQEIIVEKALETRRRAYDFSGREQVLDRFQIDRVHKHIDELEPQVINANVSGMLNSEACKAEVAEAGKIVRKHLGLRLTKQNVLLISLCSLLIYLCGYIPYLINSAKISWSVFGASFSVAFMALVLLAASGLLTLWLLRRRLIKKIEAFNKDVRAIFDRVNKSSHVYADYFSGICTYMYAKSILSGVVLKYNSDFTENKIQKAHLALLEREINQSRELCSLFEVPVNNSPVTGIFVDVDESLLTEMPSASRFYELPTYKIKNTLELDNTGQALNAPYSFITGMSIVREEIYNKRGS